MANKRDDSLNTVGKTLIVVHVPTRAKLKAAAADYGVTLCDYLRLIADNATNNKQNTLPDITPGAKADRELRLATLSAQVIATAGVLPDGKKRQMAAVAFTNWAIRFDCLEALQTVFDKLNTELEAEIAKDKVIEAGQLSWGLEYGAT